MGCAWPRQISFGGHHDKIRITESGVMWRHLDLAAAMLAENGVELRTMAHYMLRQPNGAAIEAVRDDPSERRRAPPRRLGRRT